MTHYGRVTNIEILGLDLRKCLDLLVEMALGLTNRCKAHQEQLSTGVRKILNDRLRKHNCQLPEKRQDELFAHDYLLDAQRIGVWLERME